MSLISQPRDFNSINPIEISFGGHLKMRTRPKISPIHIIDSPLITHDI
jgi:hypothetical protein